MSVQNKNPIWRSQLLLSTKMGYAYNLYKYVFNTKNDLIRLFVWSPRYSWNTVNVGVNHQSIMQSINGCLKTSSSWNVAVNVSIVLSGQCQDVYYQRHAPCFFFMLSQLNRVVIARFVITGDFVDQPCLHFLFIMSSCLSTYKGNIICTFRDAHQHFIFSSFI